MSAREFAIWRRLFLKQPFDDQGAFHLPVAQLSALTANMNRGRGAPAHKVHDFLPFHEEPEVDIDKQLMLSDW